MPRTTHKTTYETSAFGNQTNLEYLGDAHFGIILFLALIFHVIVGYGWFILPRVTVLDVPVRVLNIRLGDADLQEEDAQKPPPIVDNTSKIDEIISKPVRNETAPPPKPIKKQVAETAVKPPPTVNKTTSPRQFVRADFPDIKDKKQGSELGNSNASNAKTITDYAKNTSLWIAKFEQKHGVEGEKGLIGTALVRIRIDRRGNIRSSFIDTSSGHEELDRAALDMVRRANPVPAVPNNYPQGEMFDFLIPVTIELH